MSFSPQKWVAVLKHTVGLATLIAVTGCQSGTSTFTWKTPDLRAWKFWDRQKPVESQIASQAPMVNHQPALPSQTATPTTMTAPQYPTTGMSPYAATTPAAYPTTGYGQPAYPQTGYPTTGSPYAANGATGGAMPSAAYPGSYAATPGTPAATNAPPVQSGYYNPNYSQATPSYANGTTAGVSTASAAGTGNGAMATGYTAPTTPSSGYGYAGSAPYSQPSSASATPAYAPQATASGTGYGPTGYPQTADARNRVGAGTTSTTATGGYATGSRYDPAPNYPSTSGSDRYGTTAPAHDAGASHTGHDHSSAMGDRYGNVPAAGNNATGYQQSGTDYQQQPASSGSRYGVGPRYEGGPDRYSAGLDRPYSSSSPTSPAMQTPPAGNYRPGGTSDYIPPGTQQLNSNEHDNHSHDKGSVVPASYRTTEPSPTAPSGDAELTPPAVFTPPAAEQSTG